MIEIIDIVKGSLLSGIVQPGDYLNKVNRAAVRDSLDYYFLAADEELELEFSRNGESFQLQVEKNPEQSLGLTFPPLKPMECGNRCVFCFIDQLPPGVRGALKVKDEDYRFSFLHGSFITLSNLGKAALKRILNYRLSPLYVSVHAMDPAVRQKLLGRRTDDRFLEKLQALTAGGITLHTQIVVVPGYNDGEVLRGAIDGLAQFHSMVESIAVIPVGLTDHRRGLPPLRLLNSDEAVEIISMVEECRDRFTRDLGAPLVYPADEMLILAGKQIPDSAYYGDFPQLENGVGMVRRFIDEFRRDIAGYGGKIDPAASVILITGKAMAPFFNDLVIPELNRIEGLSVDCLEVTNSFLGSSVSVAGLLAGKDIIEALRGREADIIILPPDCANRDGLFIDDISIETLRNNTMAEVVLSDGTFEPLFQRISASRMDRI